MTVAELKGILLQYSDDTTVFFDVCDGQDVVRVTPEVSEEYSANYGQGYAEENKDTRWAVPANGVVIFVDSTQESLV